MQVGIIGLGFMGMVHYRAYQQVRGARVAALSTRNAKRLSGDWRDIRGNFGPPGAVEDLSRVRQYADWRELLDDPAIDLVDICLPPALHAPVACAALAAGKHVFCEKPIAVSLADAERMVAASTKHGRQLFVGHVLPYLPEYKFARAAIESGKYGRLLGAHFKRVVADPAWIANYYDPHEVGGPLVDLHIHDVHYLLLTCGRPKAVFSRGRLRGEVVEFVETQYVYDDPELSVTATGGVLRQQGREFTHAFEIHLERATLLFDFALFAGGQTQLLPLTRLTAKGAVERPELPGSGDPEAAFAAEIGDVVAAVAGRRAAPALAASLARDALALCHKEGQSVRRGTLVKI